jgi:Flp pilus assembly CpaE family ATPase
VLVAWSLHRLTDALLDQLDRSGLPVVVLVPDVDDERWRLRRGPVLRLDADADTIRQALLAPRGDRLHVRPQPARAPVALKPADTREGSSSRVIAVAGGLGSPGRTTVAVSLAAALGATVPTVLVEADLGTPALAAYLDLDPSRNLCTLAHVVREDVHAWGAALADELQPLCSQSSSAVALCGPPKRELRASIAPGFVERLLAELERRYAYVVVDVGAELLGADAAAASHRVALAHAHQVLLVSASDLVSLWHTRVALDQLERQLSIERQSVSLVLNRYDPRYHHPREEVEWHLGAPVAAVIPFDHSGAQRATAEQRPLVVDPSSRAGRALLKLAERVHEGKLRLPEEAAQHESPPNWWRRMLPARAPVRPKPPLRQDVPRQAAMPVARGERQAW